MKIRDMTFTGPVSIREANPSLLDPNGQATSFPPKPIVT